MSRKRAAGLSVCGSRGSRRRLLVVGTKGAFEDWTGGVVVLRAPAGGRSVTRTLKASLFLVALGVVSGCGAASAVARPAVASSAGPVAWTGVSAEAKLFRLTNFSYVTSQTETSNGSTFSIHLVGRYYSPSNFWLGVQEIVQGRRTGWQAVEAGGNYYLRLDGHAHWWKVGPQIKTSPYGSDFKSLADMTSAFPSLIQNSHATMTGGCQADGRQGTQFALSETQFGQSHSTACVDNATHMLLAFRYAVSIAPGTAGQPGMSNRGVFSVTGIGNVPPVAAPASSVPAP